MATFTDCLGRSWELRLTLGVLPKLRAVGFDLNTAAKDFSAISSLADPEMLGKVLWVLVEKQAAAKNVTAEEFADGFDGEAIQSAVASFLDTLTDFSQTRSIAAKVKALLPGQLMVQEAIHLRKIEVAFGSNNDFGNSPELPASTAAI